MGLKSKYNKEADVFDLGTGLVEVKLIGGIFEKHKSGDKTLIELDLKNNTRRRLSLDNETLKELKEVWLEGRVFRQNQEKVKQERDLKRQELKQSKGLLSDVIIEGVVSKLKEEFDLKENNEK